MTASITRTTLDGALAKARASKKTADEAQAALVAVEEQLETLRISRNHALNAQDNNMHATYMQLEPIKGGIAALLDELLKELHPDDQWWRLDLGSVYRHNGLERQPVAELTIIDDSNQAATVESQTKRIADTLAKSGIQAAVSSPINQSDGEKVACTVSVGIAQEGFFDKLVDAVTKKRAETKSATGTQALAQIKRDVESELWRGLTAQQAVVAA